MSTLTDVEIDNEPKTPHISQMSAFTARAIERLKAGKPGDTLSRDEMTEVIGRRCDTGSPGYANVSTAIRHVQNNFGIVWAWNTGEKVWRCLNAAERVGLSGHHQKKAAKSVRRSIRVIETVDESQLTEDERKKFRGQAQVAAIANLMLTANAVKKIGTAAMTAKLVIPEVDQIKKLMER